MIGPKIERWLTPQLERKGRALVSARDGGTCVKCRRGGAMNHDHRLNRSQGGDWSPSNGQLLCGSGTTGCHGWRTTHPRDAVIEGWAVAGHSTLAPAEWPARRWVHTKWGTLRLSWVLLDDDGGWLEIDEREAVFRRRKAGVIQ